MNTNTEKLYKPHRSIKQLIRTMESNKPNIDDETHDLTVRLRQQGKGWRFTRDFYNPKVEVFDLDDAPEGWHTTTSWPPN